MIKLERILGGVIKRKRNLSQIKIPGIYATRPLLIADNYVRFVQGGACWPPLEVATPSCALVQVCCSGVLLLTVLSGCASGDEPEATSCRPFKV